MSARLHKWFIEETSEDTAHMFGVKEYIVSAKTPFQEVEIADTETFGRILVLDGKIQSSEYDEYVYHEALVHPAMLCCAKPRRVLVIGGGEGATVREIFLHPGVEEVVMVDLDREVVTLCREHLPSWHRGAFDDKRLTLHYMDARDFLVDNEEQFDVIISDVPETVEASPALKLFTCQYFELVRNRLSDGGVFVLQAGDFGLPFVGTHCAILNTVRQAFPDSYSYRTFISSFNTEWAFIISFKESRDKPDSAEIDLKVRERGLSLRFLDGETAASMFSLPLNIRKLIEKEKRIIDDQNLLTSY